MKKISLAIIVAIILALSFSTAQAAPYIRKVEGGQVDGAGPGKIGYDKVSEGNLIVSWTICKDNGINECPPRPSSLTGNQNDAYDHAINEIADGNLSGQELLYGNTNVKWNASTSDPKDLEIKIWDITESEPELPIEAGW